MSKLTEALSQDKLGVCLKLEASEVKRVYRTTELLPDFDFIPYDGGTDKDYPVWHEFDLSDEAIFIHSLILDDYGYFVDDDPHDDPEYELPKATSESTGKLALELQMADRFGCRALVRGSLSGTSMEMNMDVRFNFIVASYSGESSRIGYAAEAIAEGFAFEEEGKLKQAFFSYFSALDSFVESEREKLNKGQSDDQRIKPDIRLMQKLQAIIKANMPPSVGGLDKVKIWGDVKNGFDKCEKLRNAIAHNTKTEPIAKADVDLCFAVAAIIVAMVSDDLYEEKEIREHYVVESD
ncbi:hypothetical protein NKH34_29435 [Mesorhizobium sp. M1148]|uniref:hypothetical protein n=1 Tax=unclassified Mesorhizobium TaxID=325217 RepID=UPI0003CF411A|nr:MULTISPECIES: hypothetical protein [unclassified Mesorhizobium]ESX09741.1 hypothetical protein X768_17150 [Mesorhizobium sp. LSJC265A00]ESZ56282.1 hypothetical protein X728_25695 [Mesorhizobium sp. L103C120A0]ESZ58258.1 hypothetical protein X727_32005 [Mesorhizobium sp. L103C119B0]WJI44716.1 hypothetical protein NL532_29760 [Mesorhizobium sp. C120A]